MPQEPHTQHSPEQPPAYEIRVGGRLDPTWADWFPGLAVTPEEDGGTLLRGPVADQAALYGHLRRVRDLGVPLVSVNQVDRGPAPQPDRSERSSA